MGIYVFRVSTGKEKHVAEMADKKARRVKDYKGVISAVIIPDILKGYVYVEGDDLQEVERLMSSIRGVANRAIGGGSSIDINELKDILVPRPAIEGLKEGDIVDIINGPFKGSKAKITRIDEANQEVTAEITSSSMGLPLKLHADFVKKTDAI
jgi:transcription termination/antitermination protein NusG